MLPFDRYEGNGRKLLGKQKGGDSTARHGYGLPVFTQCGTACVYCGRELGAPYESWLDISIDHVIPISWVTTLSIWPIEYKPWVDDLTNLVTCCRACNEFLNSEPSPKKDPTFLIPPNNLVAFFDLRDKIFILKQMVALEKHRRERGYYEIWYASNR